MPSQDYRLDSSFTLPFSAIALALLVLTVVVAIFDVQSDPPITNPSNIQKRFGLITWSRESAHFIIALWGCALSLLLIAFVLTGAQLIREILANPAVEVIRQLAIALPADTAASAGVIALPITLNRLYLTQRQTQAEEEGLITDRINAAVLGLGAERTVKVTEDGQVIERTEPNIEVRIGAILALERIAQKNLDVHIQIIGMIIAYVNANAKSDKSSYQYNFTVAPRQDVQIAFDVIGRRTEDQYDLEIKLEKGFRIHDAYLVGPNLEYPNYENLEFYRCDLSAAVFPIFTPDRIYISSCNLSYAHIYIGEYGSSKDAFFEGPRICRSLIHTHHHYTKKCWDQELLDHNFATEASMPSGNKHSIPTHWLPAGTPDKQIEKAWKEWLGWPTI